MKEFEIRKIDSDRYSVYLLCLTYHSILNYLPEIEATKYIRNNNGTIIIDQLLLTGNSKNRFLECNFNDGEIDLSSAKNVKLGESIKHITASILLSHPNILESSILTQSEIAKIKEVEYA